MDPLSVVLPGTWKLISRIDCTRGGERRIEPSLGEDPVALLFYDRSGNFAAQFMKRDRSGPISDGAATAARRRQVCVLGSAEPGSRAFELAAAAGDLLARLGITLVSGCGSPATRVAAERALAAGGVVVSIVPSDDIGLKNWPCSVLIPCGMGEAVPPVLVSADGAVFEGGYPWAPPLNGGFTVLELPSRDEAVAWAARIAKVCRCDQELRVFQFDPHS